MYKVYLDGEMIYSPGSEDLVLIDPTLELELNAPGEFTFTMLQNHPYYDLPRKMLSRVDVYRNDELLFRGRIIDESIDFYKNKTLTCEGELAFLNDSIQRPVEYHDMTVRGYLQTLIEYHNEQVEEDKQFTVGIVTVTDTNDSLFRYTNNNSTMEEIKEDLIDDLGGYLRVRNQNGVRYLDYLDIVDYGITNDNAIRFGTNLLDFTQDMDVTDIATVIIPLGERLEESPIEALDMRLTIESVNGGKDWLQSDEAVETYGRITKVVTWDDVTLPENLLSKGQRWLSDTQWDPVELTATAIDMNLTDAEMDAFHLGDQLRVTSSPHGLDRYFPLSKMKLPLNSPEDNEYTLGLVTTPSLMGQLTATQADMQSQLGSVSARVSDLTGTVDEKASEVLQEAKNNATQLITSATAEMQEYADALNKATSNYAEALAEGNAELAAQYYKEMQEYAEKLVASATASGHVVIEAPYNEILIMDTEDKNTALRVWRWNLNGLGYSKTGYNGEYGLAITMDGAIVADYITTGTMYADRIKGGTLTLGGYNNDNGHMEMRDSDGNTYAKWDMSELAIYGRQSSTFIDTSDWEDGIYLGKYGYLQKYWGAQTQMCACNIDLFSNSSYYGAQYKVEVHGTYIWLGLADENTHEKDYGLGAYRIDPNLFDGYDTSGNRWFRISNTNKSIYANGSYLSGSDKTLKSDIEELPFVYDTLFDKLQPKTYSLKSDDKHETHTGFVYQDVVEELKESGIDPEDSALVEEVEINEETHETVGAIDYNEIIALLVQEVQDLKAEVKELERKVTT